MSSSHDLDGEPADWLRDNEALAVRFGLNADDPDAKLRNQGAQVRMFTDARLRIAPDRLFPNVVAATRGAALSIEVRSRAERGLGFGFRIATGADPVVDRLYAVGRPEPGNFRSATVRRFQRDNRLITVDLMRARLSDSHDRDTLQRLWTCEISTWEVRQFLDPVAGRVFDERHLRFPRPPALPMAGVRAGAVRAAPNGDDGAARVNAGVIWADGSAEQRFERIQVQAENDPLSDRIGLLRVHFFVIDAD